jgi:ABC-type lipoprotein release transport system permease subunit
MRVPLIYNVRSVLQRPVSTAMTALGIATVVTVFIAMLALAEGFRRALVTTGSPANVLVLRRGADAELSSGLSREAARVIAASPHVATGPGGQPLVSPEVFVAINVHRVGDTLSMANIVARGVSPAALEVRRDVRIVAGHRFAPGRPEILVGRKLVGRVDHTAIGDTMRFGGREWVVVGHFTANGSSFESEIWGENEQFMPVFRGEVFQSVSFRLRDPAGYEEARRALEDDQRIQVDVHRETDFYAGQSALLTRILRFLGIVVTGIMAVGAVFGAVNTMYAAVGSRGPEIAVLLTLGFRPSAVLLAFLVESAVIALAGGIVGCLAALPMNGIVTGTTNWNSFTEVAFAFRITPAFLLAGLLFALVMGVLGGFFPARRAARLEVVQAIR